MDGESSPRDVFFVDLSLEEAVVFITGETPVKGFPHVSDFVEGSQLGLIYVRIEFEINATERDDNADFVCSLFRHLLNRRQTHWNSFNTDVPRDDRSLTQLLIQGAPYEVSF